MKYDISDKAGKYVDTIVKDAKKLMQYILQPILIVRVNLSHGMLQR
ncbi:DNA topoisomerase domain protein [Rickettsia amblyommatis str. Darkwater]|nr:DNA topoisomerase domain protein [Rickettsia amblyommatis str. Darkwater]